MGWRHQEDMDELETKIVIKARLVESLTTLLEQKRTEWAERSKGMNTRATAQRQFLTAHKLVKVAILNMKTKLNNSFDQLHTLVQDVK